MLSLVILAWDQLPLTQECVGSLRRHTDVPFELIIVDNGSSPEAAEWAKANSDQAILNENNRGFAAGMNQGLEKAVGEYVAFINNDTVFPPGWASSLLEVFQEHSTPGIVVPAVTAAGNPVTVRSKPGTDRVVFEPFGHLPSGVVYMMRTGTIRELGGWNESYQIATGEDLDLLFTVWANDLEVVLDARVLIQHVSEATRRRVPDFEAVLRRNLDQFLERWQTCFPPPARLTSCPLEIYERNLRHAAAAAMWLGRLIEERDRSRDLEAAIEHLQMERRSARNFLRRRGL